MSDKWGVVNDDEVLLLLLLWVDRDGAIVFDVSEEKSESSRGR